MFTEAEILTQLDACADDFVFPMLDNGYVYLVDTRLRAYRDASRWLLMIEIVGYSPRAAQLDDAIHLFGNCLTHPPGTRSEDFLGRLLHADVESETVSEHAREGLDAVLLRGVRVPLVAHVDPWPLPELFRSLTPAHRDLLFADDAELAQRVPDGLTELLRLEAWHHPDLLREERPSGSETFRGLARALVSGDASQYVPSAAPNTHWSNWPEGGSL